MKTIHKILLVGGGLVIGGVLFCGRGSMARNKITTKFAPIPPWANEVGTPEEWNKASFWSDIGAIQSKIYAAQTILTLHDNPTLMPKPSMYEFEAYYKKIGKRFGIPYMLLRANHREESYPETAPLTLNTRSTALGLAQLLVGSAKTFNVPYHHLADWRTSIWATARHLKSRGWNRKSLPSINEINAAAKLAGTSDEPKWFKAQRGYWGAYKKDHKSFQKSVNIAVERFTLAHKSFKELTTKGLPMWNTIPHEAKLIKFFEGTAKSINWKEA